MYSIPTNQDAINEFLDSFADILIKHNVPPTVEGVPFIGAALAMFVVQTSEVVYHEDNCDNVADVAKQILPVLRKKVTQ